MIALAQSHRYRVVRDPDGWPIIPGKLGRLEWHDEATLAVYSDRPRLFARLWTVPGVRRWQVGDQEVRGLLSQEALPAVARLIQARRRRPATSAGHLQRAPDPAYRVTSAV